MNAPPGRLRLSRAKGWRLPKGAVNVARPGRWGNPFETGRDGDRERCTQLFIRLLAGYVCVSAHPDCVAAQRRWLRRNPPGDIRRLLAGHDLACWCALDAPCHADALLEVANVSVQRSAEHPLGRIAGSPPANAHKDHQLIADLRAMADEMARKNALMRAESYANCQSPQSKWGKMTPEEWYREEAARLEAGGKP